jgi:RNA polymerase sigma-70 factor (ECF subfamily)
MSYIDDMQNKQIAKMLGISVSTVENHIYSALKRLREMLKDNHIAILLFLAEFL